MLDEPIPPIVLLKPMSICFNINMDQLPSEIVSVGTAAHCQLSKDIYPFLENSRSGTNSEMALISRDDSLLNIICSISGLQKDRNTISSSTIALNRLDVFLAMNGMPPIVHVEEKWGDADLPNAIQDLNRKFCTLPHYNSKLLFIMAIAIAGDMVCFGKLYLGGKFERIKTFNLRSGLKERVYCVRAAINVGRWARYVLNSDLVAPITFPIGKKQVQDRRELTFLSEGIILKKYLKLCKSQRGWLSHLYKCVTSATKRNVRFLEWAISCAESPKKSTVTVRLQPFGVVRFPQSQTEMRSALRCVLTCLADLHRHGWTHLDLRWSNVVYVAPSQWFVIDAELARPIGSEMPHGLVLRDPDATVADEAADCFLVSAMMRDPRAVGVLDGLESAHELAEFLCRPSADPAEECRPSRALQRGCSAAQALGMPFFHDGP
jgi:hypothetical protein